MGLSLEGLLGPVSGAILTGSYLRVICGCSLPVRGPCPPLLGHRDRGASKGREFGGRRGPFQAVELGVVLNLLSCLF